MSLYLGIDLGTSACRACVIDADRRECASAAAPLPAPRRDGHAVEQDPAQWWWALEHTLDALRDRVGLERVERIAVDGTSATLLLCRPDGAPLTPALMYNDSRATAEAGRIAALAPADSPARSPTSSLAKLLWLARAVDDPCVALHQADWLAGRLCGRFDTSDENNALKLGYDAGRRCWPDWLRDLGPVAGCLPRVQAPGTPLAPVLPAWRARWGLAADATVVAGTTDSTAAFLATGARLPGTAVTSLGSTLVLKVLAEAPVAAGEYGVYSHRLGDRWLAGGASNSGGAVLRQFFDDRALAELSARLRPHRPGCLDYYPLPAPGERFPVDDPALPPRLTPRPRDDLRFLQGLLEGIARIERLGYRRLAELGAPWPERVLTVGGGAVNEAWRRIRERMLGVPVEVALHQEAAYGAALLARQGVA